MPTITPLPIPDVVSNYLEINWRNSVTINTSFLTDIVSSTKGGYEDRRGLRTRPLRSISGLFTSIDSDSAARLQSSILRWSESTRPFPIWPDLATLVTTVYSGDTQLYCNTRGKRIYPGQRLLITDLGPFPDLWEYVTVDITDTSVLETTINIIGKGPTDGLVNNYPIGAVVYPCIDADLTLSSKGYLITNRVAELNIIAEETTGNSTIPVADINDLSDFPEIPFFNGVPLLNPLWHNWAKRLDFGSSRSGVKISGDRGRKTIATDEDPSIIFNIKTLSKTRIEAATIIKFFESRQGRLFSFWMLNPQDIWILQTADADNIDIEPDGNFKDYEKYYQYVCIQKGDKFHISKIDFWNDLGSFYRIQLTDAEAIPAEFLPPDNIFPAHLSRFTQDTLTENWYSSEICEIDLNIKEIRNDSAVGISSRFTPVGVDPGTGYDIYEASYTSEIVYNLNLFNLVNQNPNPIVFNLILDGCLVGSKSPNLPSITTGEGWHSNSILNISITNNSQISAAGGNGGEGLFSQWIIPVIWANPWPTGFGIDSQNYAYDGLFYKSNGNFEQRLSHSVPEPYEKGLTLIPGGGGGGAGLDGGRGGVSYKGSSKDYSGQVGGFISGGFGDINNHYPELDGEVVTFANNPYALSEGPNYYFHQGDPEPFDFGDIFLTHAGIFGPFSRILLPDYNLQNLWTAERIGQNGGDSIHLFHDLNIDIEAGCFINSGGGGGNGAFIDDVTKINYWATQGGNAASNGITDTSGEAGGAAGISIKQNGFSLTVTGVGSGNINPSPVP